ncbi:MAG: agmatine deiminase family protein [Bacteroidia bacterium]
MITDNESNFLYLSDLLPKRFPDFYRDLTHILNQHKINFGLLSGTKDIWAVDYMPIQIDKDTFVQFKYSPDYLNTIKWSKTITDVDLVCDNINLNTKKSPIVLDGGNIIKWTNKIIMCDKVFDENPHYKQDELIREICSFLEVDEIIFVPKHPKDFIGHADAMVRFVDEKTVLINDYSKESNSYYKSFRLSLHNAGLDCIEFPYNPYNNKNYEDATGEYINFLQMKNFILLPVFNLKEDILAYNLIKSIFPNYKIDTIDSIELAKMGGVLNCISWNILK